MNDWDANAGLPGHRSVLDPADAGGTKNALIDRVQRAALSEALRAVPAGARALDLGCGTGRLTSWLAGAGLGVVGVDGSEPMLQQARARGVAAPLARADAAALPFADGALGLVLSVGVLAVFAPDEERFAAVLGEAARVLAPGGSLVAIEQAGDEDFGRGASVAGYRAAFEAAGLRVESAEPVRLGDSPILARCARHPWLGPALGRPSRLRREARSATGPLTGGRYADVLFVATATS